MQKSTWITLVVVALLALLGLLVGRFIYYGAGGASAYTPPDRPRSIVAVESAPMLDRLEAVDNPQVSEGVVIIDYAHDNALYIEELNVLLSKIVDRGYSYEIVTTNFGFEEDEENGSDGDSLIDKLRYANAFVIPLARAEYTPEEVMAIERFVEKGGRLLIIGDPTRTVAVEPLNSIAGAFGITYANDYLYSLESNDNNYRNVVYTNFNDSPITQGLDENSKIIFYSSASIYAPGSELILGDDTTYSSTSEGGRDLSTAVLTTDDSVLALGDLTFFTEPYSNAENNEILINNIATFLSKGERDTELKDFPYIFNPEIDIVYDNPLVFNSQFDDSVRLKETLEELNHSVYLVNEMDDENDIIFVGRLDETEPVEDYLADAGITILDANEKTEEEEVLTDPEEEADQNKIALISDEPVDEESQFVAGRIQIEGVGELEKGGATLYLLRQEEERNILIILSDTPTTNADAFNMLLQKEFTDCLVSPDIAVCQTEEPDDQLPPSLRSYRIDNILIVSDDTGRERSDIQTSVLDYYNVLSSTYTVDAWTTSTDGYPFIEELLEYDAVIWTTGDYWDDSVGAEGAEVLTEYVTVGGNLILSGASIAFDWEHSDFLAAVPHAEYLGFGEQSDLEVNLTDHPIANGLADNSPIEFVSPPSGEPLPVDIVGNTSDARVIFRRGFNSEEPGEASVIAYEDDRVKIAYMAFPVYLLPAEAKSQLINNTVTWFSKRPLPLPEDDSEYYDETEEEEAPADEDSNGDNGQDNGEEETDEEENGNGES